MLAVVLLGISGATIEVINNNDLLDSVRKSDDELTDPLQELQDLILRSYAVASWLVVLSTAIVIAEIISIILLLSHFESPTLKLFLGIMVSIAVIVVSCNR